MSELLSTVNYMTKHNFLVTRYNYISHSNYVLTIPLVDGGVLYISAKYVEHCLNVTIGVFKVGKNLILDSYDAYIDPIGLFNNMDVLIHMLDGEGERVDSVVLYYDTGCRDNECRKDSMLTLQYTYGADFYNYQLMKENDEYESTLFKKSSFPIQLEEMPECSIDIHELIYGKYVSTTENDTETTNE